VHPSASVSAFLGGGLPQSLGVLSGTGPHGRGLARRFAIAGYDVRLGSRAGARAGVVADRLMARVPQGTPRSLAGVTNAEAAECDVVIVAAAWAGCTEVLSPIAEQLHGKVVVSCVNPLGFGPAGTHRLPTDAPSAAEHVAALLPDSRVVGAFHHLSASSLLDPSASLTGEEVLVCGDKYEAKAIVRRLCHSLTSRVGIDAGPLHMARHIEAFTAVLISINKRYGVQSGVAFPQVPALRTIEATGSMQFGALPHVHPTSESA
jgi:NADPH-dependent F420 reductase